MLKKGELCQQAVASYGFDVISFGAARSAFEQGVLWQPALPASSLHVISFKAAIYEKGGRCKQSVPTYGLHVISFDAAMT
eukprot:3287392-Karenia_brevis.AAC.1